MEEAVAVMEEAVLTLIGVVLGGAIGIITTLIGTASARKLSREERDEARHEKADLELLLWVQRMLEHAAPVTITERQNALAQPIGTNLELHRVSAMTWLVTPQVRERFRDAVTCSDEWLKATDDAGLKKAFDALQKASNALGREVSKDMAHGADTRK